MEVQLIVKIDIMHVKGPPTQLAQVSFFNPFKSVHVNVVMKAWDK